MSREQHTPLRPELSPRSNRIVNIVGLIGIGAGLGFSASVADYDRSENTTVIAGRVTEVSPTMDGYATFALGELPDVRLPMDLPFNHGLHLDVGNSVIPASAGDPKISINQIGADYLAAFAAQPDGEIENIKQLLRDQALESGLKGGAVALLPLSIYGLLGARRRRELGDTLATATDRYELLPVLSALTIGATILGVIYGEVNDQEPSQEVSFVNLSSKIARSADIDGLDNLEVRNIALTTVVAEGINGVLSSYEESTQYFERLLRRLDASASLFHQPTDGQKVSMIVSDRHSNILADPLLRHTADLAQATSLYSVGDDTSTGAQWEMFSPRSLRKEFDGFPMAAILGNHDNSEGGFVRKFWQDKGVLVSNEKVQTFEDSSIILVDDTRSSDFTPQRREGEFTEADASKRVQELACADERVNIAIVPKADMADDALEKGCLDLAIGADTHVQTEPEAVIGEDGAVGYKLTNGTTGGAAYAFALGKFRREASETFVTFEDGKPVGTQIVRLGTDGTVTVGDYTELFPRSADAISSPTPRSKGKAIVSPNGKVRSLQLSVR